MVLLQALGATSFFIHALKYLKEKPKIEAEVTDAKHYYTSRRENEADYFLTFQMTTRVRNRGDQGTTIGEATF